MITFPTTTRTSHAETEVCGDDWLQSMQYKLHMSRLESQKGMINIGNVCYANAAFMAIRGLEWYQYLNKAAFSYTIGKIEKIMNSSQVIQQEQQFMETLKESEKKKINKKEVARIKNARSHSNLQKSVRQNN